MMLELLLDTMLPKLPDLLKDRSKWDSLIVNRRKPATYRVFTNVDGYRICLHRFDPCHLHESFDHPHPWPGAFLLLEGSYRMRIGSSADRVSKPVAVTEQILTPGSAYSITTPLTWHSVTPLTTTYTIMVNGEPWPADFAHQDVRTTKGKDLDKMPEAELKAHLRKFQGLVRGYLVSRQIREMMATNEVL